MVVQRDTNASFWGWAAPGENVTITGSWGKTVKTTASQKGKWSARLSTPEAGGPFTITFQGSNKLELKNVLSGEVWLCSGQSNMEWPVIQADDSRQEIATANYPNIRLFHVKKKWDNRPQTKLTGKWKICTPENVPYFSAAAYFFGRKLHSTLNIPVGLINVSWSGTLIEPWIPPVGFANVPSLEHVHKEIEAKTSGSEANKYLTGKVIQKYKTWISQTETSIRNKSEVKPPPSCPRDLLPYTTHQSPSVLYNAMINPMVPYAMRGAIWYQGEANRRDGLMYGEKMKALISGWRNVYKNKYLSFYFVQLAPYNYRENPYFLPSMWETQVKVTKMVHGTGIAIINDIGDLENIHPTNKQEVGKRLALLALNKTYGMKDIVCDSPVLKEIKVENNAIKVIFANAKRLSTRDGKEPDWFEICGADGIFKPAQAKISGISIILTAEDVENPCAVRYAWHMMAIPNLVNEAGLPASAFRGESISGKLEYMKTKDK